MKNSKKTVNLLLFGLQRSGTNFLESILNKNYRVNFLNDYIRTSPCNKHFRLYDEKNIIPEPQYKNEIFISSFEEYKKLISITPDYFIIISKNPYSWFLSYNKWADKCNWPKVYHHYIYEYNLFYGKWIELSKQTDQIVFVKYIDLLQNTEKELSRLELEMGLSRRVFIPFFSSRISKVPQSNKFSKKQRDFYLNEKYLEVYDEKELQSINNLLDSKLLFDLGYEKKS